MDIKIIRSESDYDNALALLIELFEEQATQHKDNSEQIQLLKLVIKDYEDTYAVIPPPDPIDAIKFMMEQQDLTARDLIPLIGSRSKVSEVLSRKRPLSLNMIRALGPALGIPSEVLVQQYEVNVEEIQWKKFPLRKMINRGWFNDISEVPKEPSKIEEMLKAFCAPMQLELKTVALFRRTRNVRIARTIDEYALFAWTCRVVQLAQNKMTTVKFRPESLSADFLSTLVRMSQAEDGPLQAINALQEIGVTVVVEPHLPKTYLDGAAIMLEADAPIIGLTIREDRIDNFWFCLLHELGHLALHQSSNITRFYDDLEYQNKEDDFEIQADTFARDSLVDPELWRRSPASRVPSPDAARLLAKQAGIHVAIAAGRIQHELGGNYRILRNLLGQGQVKKLFPEVNWNG